MEIETMGLVIWALIIIGIGASVLICMQIIHTVFHKIKHMRKNSKKFWKGWENAVICLNFDYGLVSYSDWDEYDLRVMHLTLLNRKKCKIEYLGEFYADELRKLIEGR